MLYAGRLDGYLMLGQIDKAEGDLKVVQKLNPSSPFTAVGEGYLSLLKRHADAAFTSFQRASKLNGEPTPDSLLGSSLAYQMKGDTAKSTQLYKEYRRHPGYKLDGVLEEQFRKVIRLPAPKLD